MIQSDKSTSIQREEIIKDIVTILAHHEGFTLEQEIQLPPDNADVMRWNKTANSIFDAVLKSL